MGEAHLEDGPLGYTDRRVRSRPCTLILASSVPSGCMSVCACGFFLSLALNVLLFKESGFLGEGRWFW